MVYLSEAHVGVRFISMSRIILTWLGLSGDWMHPWTTAVDMYLTIRLGTFDRKT